MRMNIAKRDSHLMISARQDFRASSLTGQNSGDVYKVYSYWTIIAEYRDGVWYVNDTGYSVTTSSHQSQVRQAVWGQEYVTLTHVPTGTQSLSDRVAGKIAEQRANRIRKEVAV
jgi:hypothetical protein